MSEELETAGAVSLGGFFRRNKVELLPPGTPCPNCATSLEGPWCHACGQLGEDFHRSAAKLLLEAARESLDLDGRILRTLPDLMVRPGRLTRAYLDGHRAPQVPPLRLFLVVLVLLFLIGWSRSPAFIPASPLPATRAETLKRIENDKRISPADRQQIEAEIKNSVKMSGNLSVDHDSSATAKWLIARGNNAIAHQKEFWQAIQNWAERFAVLMLPLSAILLSLLFAFQRRFFLFDHIIFSMHSLSFLCLLLAATIVINRYVLPVGGWPLLAAPVHLFAHMRGVYRTSTFGTLARMFVLFIGSAMGFAFLIVGLVWIALSAMS
jgi:uncharacterized protein DUF3667